MYSTDSFSSWLFLTQFYYYQCVVAVVQVQLCMNNCVGAIVGAIVLEQLLEQLCWSNCWSNCVGAVCVQQQCRSSDYVSILSNTFRAFHLICSSMYFLHSFNNYVNICLILFQVPQLSNFSYGQQRYISIPLNDDGDEYDSCQLYNLDWDSYSYDVITITSIDKCHQC